MRVEEFEQKQTYVARVAVVVRLYVSLAVVARVDEVVSSLGVQFVEHCHRGELGPA